MHGREGTRQKEKEEMVKGGKKGKEACEGEWE